ncbi:MFS general substrate transporter [Meredithblackwellia eburnea MCA 4105]
MQAVGEIKVNAEGVKNESSPEPVLVTFGRDDPENPQEGWSALKQWRVLLIAFFITFTSTFNSAGQGSVSSGFRKEHPSITSEVFITSNFAYQLMLGVGPLFLAPLSESFGRRPMLCVLSFIIMLLFLPQALAPNFASILATRFFQGIGGSVEGPVVAGIVADVKAKKDRGTAMATFVVAVYAGNGLGPVCSNWIAYKVNWHWVYWMQMIMAFVALVLCFCFLPETRGELILEKRAKSISNTSAAGNGRQTVLGGGIAHTDSFFERMKGSISRPLIYLFTEPIVAICALWIGSAWGIVFLFIGAIAHVFTETYGFNQGQASSVLICGLIGAILGWISNETIQERLYQREVIKGNGKAKPEARLYSTTVGGALFAIGAFGFAWTARPWIHWIAPCIFITMANLGLYTIYLATYNYLSDVYDRYSSSAQAAQSLLRGILGAVFPFFGIIMYDNLTFKWASTLVGFIGCIFAIIPFLMIRYGPALRARSKVAVHLSHLEGFALPATEEMATTA